MMLANTKILNDKVDKEYELERLGLAYALKIARKEYDKKTGLASNGPKLDFLQQIK